MLLLLINTPSIVVILLERYNYTSILFEAGYYL